MIPREELLRVRRIASRVNPKIKDWASLGDRGNRDRLGCTLAEGVRLAGEGLEAASGGGGMRPSALLVSDAGAAAPGALEAFVRAGELGVPRYSVSDDCFAKVSGLKAPDGVALVMEFTRGEVDVPSLFGSSDSAWLFAAGVQDPGNAGALARTALAAGWTGCVYIDGVDPSGPKFLRGSMGAAFRLPCLATTLEAFVRAWPGGGARLIVASSGGDGEDYREVDYARPLGLVVGGERGVPEALAGLASGRAHIPLRGGVESLNLAVAAGILLFAAGGRWQGHSF